MLKTTRRLLWAGYWLLVALAVLLAMLVLLLRLLLPRIDQYSDDVAQQIARLTGAEVQIEQLAGEWQGVFPLLRLQGLELSQSDQYRFTLKQASISLNLSESLLQLRPVFNQLHFESPQLSLQLSAEASSADSSSPTVPVFPLWVLDQPLELSGGHVEIHRGDAPVLEVRDISAGLVAVRRTWQMTLDAQLGREQEFRSARIVIEGQGAPQRGRVWLYGELDGLAPSLLQEVLPEGLALKSTNLRQQFWARIQGGELKQAQALSDLRALQLGEQWALTDSQLLFDLQRVPSGLQLQLHDSALVLNDKRLSLPVVAADFDRQWQLKTVQIPELALAPITDFLKPQPLSETLQGVVKDLDLRGALKNVRAQWPADNSALDAFELAADLEQVSFDAWDDVPQILGINGRLEADATGGKIHLDSSDFTLNFPTLFPDGWRYSEADGVVAWSLLDDAAVIHSELLHLKQPEIEANGRFSLHLPFDGGQTELTLMIGTRAADGRVAPRYVPPAEVGKDLHRWLSGAIRAGDVKRGAFLLNGGTRSRLDDYQMPVVQMFFDVEQAEFAYQPGWPAITGGNAFMLYKDGALSVDVTEGRLLESDIGRAWVGLRPDGSRLDIIGDLKGDAADVRTLLLESPLRELTGDELARWQMSGALTTDLALAIPLTAGKPDVDVVSTLTGGTMSSKLYRLEFSEIEGQLRYQTPLGLQAENLKTSFFGHRSQVNIISERLEAFDNAIRTQVQLDSRIDMAVLRDWLALPFLNIARGETWYRARLNLCQTSVAGCSGLDVRSSLQGVEVVGPRMLAKSADSQRYFQMTSDLAEEERLSLRYGDDVRARLLLKDQSLERGRIAFNRTPVTLPPDPGLRVIGTVPELEFERLMLLLERAGLWADGGQVVRSGTGAGRAEMLHSVALNIGTFRIGDTEVTGLDTLVKPERDGWALNIASEMLTGTARFPYNGDPYQIDIAGLNLTSSKVPDTAQIPPEVTLKPEALPRSDVNIQQLTLNGKPLGSWAFKLLPQPDGARIQEVKGKLQGLTMNGALDWSNGLIDESSLTLKVQGGNLADVLEAWGHGRALSNDTFSSNLQLEWPGAPWQFGIARTTGNVRFVVKKGQLVETGASSNFLRLFGILNLNALGRRLRLDFSDLFRKGVAFDRIGGDYQLARGIARTRKPFEMAGPSVDMKLNGQIDLVNETLNKRMEVTLPVTSNLPVVGVLLGATPQVAGAVFLIDKLIGDQLQKFTTIRYRISGSWDDPQITLPGEEKKTPAKGSSMDKMESK